MTKIIPLFSGSSGNCTYIKYGETEILIDAGVSCKAINSALNSIGTDLKNISGIFVTHEHEDHIKGLRIISKGYGIPVYINQGSLEAVILGREGESVAGCACVKNAGDSVDVGEIHADIFKTPHDAYGSVGYKFSFSDGSSFGYATDIGYITKGIAAALFGCDTVILESNHDVQMLRNGPYPFHLKERILSDKGHLSNEACASFIPHLCANGTKKVILAHLSEHNNTPLLAYNTSVDALTKAGIDMQEFKLTVAKKSII